jgi:hypothetical protein
MKIWTQLSVNELLDVLALKRKEIAMLRKDIEAHVRHNMELRRERDDARCGLWSNSGEITTDIAPEV